MANINYTKPNKLEDFSVWCSKRYPLWCKSNFPFIEDTFEALDTYGLICKIVQYLNETKQNLNTTEDNVQNIYDFVTNYFDNLDVQNEINKKIDELVKNGLFDELFNNFIEPTVERQDSKISYIENQVNQANQRIGSISSGSPSGVYDTLEELIQDNPSHDKIYVVLEDGEWYFWDESISQWKNGGIYQATKIAKNEIGLENLNYYFKENSDNLLNSEFSLENQVWKPNESVNSNTTTSNTLFESFDAIPVIPNQVLIPLLENGKIYDLSIDQVLYFDINGNYINYSLINKNDFPFTIPENVYYIKITSRKSSHLAQIKDYNDGNYNPNYSNYLYNPKFVMKKEIESIKNIAIPTITFTDNTYIFGLSSSSNAGKALSDEYSSIYSVTDFIEVSENDIIYAQNITASSNVGVCVYDNNKKYIKTILTQSNLTDLEYIVESGVKYIRYTIFTSEKNIFKCYYKNIRYERILKLLNNFNIFENKTNLKVENILNTYANKPVFTWIDDDCNPSSIPLVKNLCDLLNIKCTFACITNNLTENLSNLLKSYQLEGFHVTSHTNTHHRWYREDNGQNIFTLNECESDLIQSLVKLNELNILENDYIVAPGGSANREGISKIIDKWAKCLVSNSTTKVYNELYNPDKFHINRLFLNKSLHDIDFYKQWIDEAYSKNAWIILGTHSYNSTEYDESMMNEIIQYVQNKNIEIKTLNQAFNDRKLVYDLKELFS